MQAQQSHEESLRLLVSARAAATVFMPLRQQPGMLWQASLPASVIRRQQMTDSTQSLSLQAPCL